MPYTINPEILTQLILLAQRGQSTASPPFSLAVRPEGTQYAQGFSLAAQPKGQPNALQIGATGGKKTNWNDMLRGMAVAVASTLAFLKDSGDRIAPPVDVGFKYPTQIKSPYRERPVGFRSILGGRNEW